MTEGSNKLTKLRQRLFLVKLVLFLSFSAAAGTTILSVMMSFTPAGYGPIAGTTATQTTLLTTATTIASTTLFSSTASTTPLTLGPPEAPLAAGPILLQQYSSSAALISWAVFAGALIWRGHVRTVWGKSRFSCDTFRLLVRMRGAQTRLKLMHSLNEPKNKLQLATALGIDWKAVDRHVHVLERNGLIEATTTSGTAVFYEITEKGKRLLQVLEELGSDSTYESH